MKIILFFSDFELTTVNWKNKSYIVSNNDYKEFYDDLVKAGATDCESY